MGLDVKCQCDEQNIRQQPRQCLRSQPDRRRETGLVIKSSCSLKPDLERHCASLRGVTLLHLADFGFPTQHVQSHIQIMESRSQEELIDP
ncbi:hypothetical protein Y1Q_0015561 [Alligator mississippiensis]|uniref:Uncharacterized protein n=1 Tax=Alligator mississippiensis TaxID=8496 RepID=A0A151NN92_ALLMI|nr:hypothetical protein Y1Q_0015561 [Alligator mississippiensis]